MPTPKSTAVKEDQLNRMAPAARDAALGDVIVDLMAQVNALVTDVNNLRTRHNAAMVKLDADAGVTDTNYNALQAAPAITAQPVGDLSTR